MDDDGTGLRRSGSCTRPGTPPHAILPHLFTLSSPLLLYVVDSIDDPPRSVKPSLHNTSYQT